MVNMCWCAAKLLLWDERIYWHASARRQCDGGDAQLYPCHRGFGLLFGRGVRAESGRGRRVVVAAE